MWKAQVKPRQGIVNRRGIMPVLAFLTLALILSSLAATTFAWTGFSQAAYNEHSGAVDTTVQLLKLEKDANGTPADRVLSGAEFYLYKVSTQAGVDDTQIGTRYLTDEEGIIAIIGLASGDYYFLETRPDPRHSFDVDENDDPITRYNFSIDGSEEQNTIVVTAYNRPLLASLILEKLVENADGSPPSAEQLAQEFAFTIRLFGVSDGFIPVEINGVETQFVIQDEQLFLSLKHGDTLVFPGLPAGTLYRVTEAPESGYIITSTNHSGTISEIGAEVLFTNTYFEELDIEGDLTVTKQITGTDADMTKRFDFTLSFTPDAEHPVPDPVYYRINDGALQTLSTDGRFRLGNNDRITFLDLPEGISYVVTEDDYITEAYLPNYREYRGTVSNGEIVLPYLNTYTGAALPQDYGFLQIAKQVRGVGANPDQLFTFTVTLTGGALPSQVLYRIDGGAATPLGADGRIELKHGQTALFEPLPHGVGYTIVEEPIPGYTSATQHADGVITEFQTSEIVFVNETLTPLPALPATTITMRKEVLGEVSAADRDKEYHFRLLIDGVPHEFTLKNGEFVIFDDVVAGAIYDLWEDDYSDDGFDQRVAGGYGTANGIPLEIVASNTSIYDAEVSIEGEKTWDLKGYSPTLPESVLLTLKNEERVAATALVTPDAEGKWLYTWDVPKYETDGVTELVYTVEETPLAGWISTGGEGGGSGGVGSYDIQNTYIPPLVHVDPPVLKALEGDEPPHDATFRFVMTALDSAPMPVGAQDGSKTVSITGTGEVEFGDINYVEAGTYRYTISEINDGEAGYTYDTAVYTLTLEVVEEEGALQLHSRTLSKDGFPVTPDDSDDPDAPGDSVARILFTNHYADDPNPADEKVTISGSKTWNHESNAKENYPASITVILKANGAVVSQWAVSAANNWAWTFTLDKYDASGIEIVYTIDETPVPGYTLKVNGYNLINTYNPDLAGTGAVDSVQTGDALDLGLWIALALVSLAALILTIIVNKKYHPEN